jgi:RHS repeat-associated protein
VAWHDSVNNTLNIQVNNGTVSSVSYTSGAMDTTYPLSIGAHSNGSYGFDGRIDEVVLYKRVLNSAQRSWLYNNGAGRTYSDLTLPNPSGPTTYTYGSSAHKHAVTSLSTGETYAYDANGNMITRVEGGATYTQTFNAENRLISVTVNGQTTHFIYDGDGNLIKKINPDGSRTLYVGGIYEVDKDDDDDVTRTVTYYPAGGAMRIDGTLYFVLKDHLGSASVVTDANGALVPGADTRYYPFGEARFSTSLMLTDKLYTGQREMADLGIYHYNARFYSPYINRFLSADTIVPGYANPQNFNRYSYVINNPLRYTDPTGHMQVQDGPQQDDFSQAVYDSYEPQLDNDDDEDDDNPGGGGGHPLLSPNPTVTLENSYCGGGPNGAYNFFDCAANVTQDLSLLIDTPFAFGELVLITAGCFAGPQGCLAGAGVADTVFNVTGANGAETVLSLVSMVSSFAADYADDNHFGESTVTAAVTGVGGLFSPDPLIDFAIDGFGSAYNHDVNPISNIPSLIGSLFSP